jgi:PKD domain/Bacterial TSP3 repeat/Right handed beta helix region
MKFTARAPVLSRRSIGVAIIVVIGLLGLQSLAFAISSPHRQHAALKVSRTVKQRVVTLLKSNASSSSRTDTDRDGLSNWTEVNRTKTNPRKADTDGDGLSDGAEVNRTKTSPRKVDSDGDGYSDGKEIAAGSDPLDPTSTPASPTPNPGTPPPPSQPPVDTTPPQTSIVSGPIGTTESTNAIFSFTASEGNTTFACKLDGGTWGSCKSPKSYSGLSVGSHLFSVRATDSVGNTDQTPATRSWTVQAPPPPADPAHAVWTPPAEAQVEEPVTLDGTESSGTGTLACTWSFENQDGSAVFQTQKGCNIAFTFESTGTKYVKLTVEDSSGSSDSNKQSFEVAPAEEEEDTVPPNTTIGSGPSGTTTVTTASFSFSSSEPGSSFQCQLDGSQWTACTSPAAYSSLGAGGHSFSVRATDSAGNIDPTPATRSWSVEITSPPPPDTTAPETTISAGPSGSTTETSASLSFSSSESGSSFACKLDGGSYSSCTSPKSYSGLSLGAHTFSVIATDAAGNADASPATRSWTIVEATPPPPSGCVTGATGATTAAQVRSAVQANQNVCVTAAVGDVNLSGLGAHAVVVSANGGSMDHISLSETTKLTIRNARFTSIELWYANNTTIESSVIGGSPGARTEDNLVNVNVSKDVTIRGNEIAWTLAGNSGFAGYGIRSPGNSLGYNDRLHIEGNYIHNIAADGIQGLGSSQDVVIDRNRIDYIGQEAGSSEHADAMQIIDHGSNARITNNWISHEGYFEAGKVSGGSGTLYVHGGDNDTLLIENNLFSESQGRVLIAGLGTGGTSVSNLTVRRNTFLEDGKSYASFPSFHWAVTSGSNNMVERNVAQDEDGGFSNQGSLSTASFVENLWRDRDVSGALAFDSSGNCTSAACNPSGQEAIGYRKPSGVSW